MTPDDFQQWAKEAKKLYNFKFDSDLAKLLDVTNGTFVSMKKGRTKINRRTALACSHLLANGKPYPEGN